MIKKFIPYYKPHKHLLIIDLSCALLASGLELVFPGILKHFIDEILPLKQINYIYLFGAVLFGIIIIRMFLNYIICFWGHTLGSRMEFDMRNDLFKHVHKLSFNFFDNTKTGYIMSRVVNDLFLVV